MSRGTVHRTVRIEEGLWKAAKTRADAEGVSLSDVIRAALQSYVEPIAEAEIWKQASPSIEYTVENYPHGTMTDEEFAYENYQTEDRVKRLRKGEPIGPRVPLTKVSYKG